MRRATAAESQRVSGNRFPRERQSVALFQFTLPSSLSLVLVSVLAASGPPSVSATEVRVPATALQAVSATDTSGVPRAMELFELLDRDRGRDPRAALQWGREALALLEGETAPELEVDVLAEMAWAHMVLGEYEEATSRAETAREKAGEIGYGAGSARAINNLGVIARRKGDPVTALAHFTASLSIQEKVGSMAGIATAYSNIGFVYSVDLGDFEAGLENNLKALGIRRAMSDTLQTAASLNNIGVLYLSMGRPEEAEDYLTQALDFRQRHGNEVQVASTLSNLGEAQLALGAPERALARFRPALEVRQKAGDQTGIAAAHRLIGAALLDMGEFDAARASLQEALADAERLGENRSLLRVHQSLGRLSQVQGHYREANRHFQAALEYAGAMSADHLVAELYGQHAEALEDQGDFPGALLAQKRFKSASDRVLNRQKAGRMAALESRERTRMLDQKQHDRELEDLRRQQEAVLRNAGLVLIVTLLALGLASERRRSAMSREMTEQLAKAAVTDPLTGLRNRRGFIELADHERARMRRAGQRGSLILLDIDHFKGFNDTYGHVAGDRVLEVVGRVLTSSAREEDVVARWGGEEFAMLLPDTAPAEAELVAERLRLTLSRQDHQVDGAPVRVTITVGVAEAEWDATIDQWIAAADQALYAGKNEGRDRVVVAEGANSTV